MMSTPFNQLRLVKLGIDTLHESIIYMHSDCFICKSEGFESLTQVIVSLNHDSIVATLNMVHSDVLKENEASLSESVWKKLSAKEGDFITISHLPPVTSMGYLRSKIHGNPLNAEAFQDIISDIVCGKYSNIHLSSFVTACSLNHLSIEEIIYLTKAMIETGEQLHWTHPMILDKHSVGGIPGNKTTPIVVSIVAAAGLMIPKTSSRAITSPAGTVDTVETMTTVDLSVERIQQVVESEGGCMAWGGRLGFKSS